MRAPLYRRLSPLMVYYKTFGILTLRTSWLPSRCHSFYGYALLATFDDETPLAECTLKIIVSMPDCSSIDLSQWATELEEIGLYGLIVASSSLVSCPWIGSVFFS